MPMKLKNIPALFGKPTAFLCPAPCRGRYLIGPPFLVRPTRPQGGGNFRPEPTVQKLAPRSPARRRASPAPTGAVRPPSVLVMARGTSKT